MALGYDREPDIFNRGDSAEIFAFIYDRLDAAIPQDDIDSVAFTVQAPDGTLVLDSSPGTVAGDGQGTIVCNDTDQIGEYTVIATFSMGDIIRSVRADFEVIDPLAPAPPEFPSATYIVANEAWEKFEDCFDAEDEGPWLRDMTLNFFNKSKMSKFIDDALLDINLQHPPTSLGVDYFVHDNGDGSFLASADLPLLAEGIVLQIIRHLMRSYVEQPNPVGAQIAWHDRRDYLQRWQVVYGMEKEQYMRMLALFKRRFLGLGQNKVLVASKAGRLIPAPLRTRNVGRGYF